MSILKETNYSGSRAYDGERRGRALIDHLRLRMSLNLAWTRLQIEKFLRLGAAPRRTSSLMDHGEKHFTLLGTRQRLLPARRRITDIFPISDSDGRTRKSRNDSSPW